MSESFPMISVGFSVLSVFSVVNSDSSLNLCLRGNLWIIRFRRALPGGNSHIEDLL